MEWALGSVGEEHLPSERMTEGGKVSLLGQLCTSPPQVNALVFRRATPLLVVSFPPLQFALAAVAGRFSLGINSTKAKGETLRCTQRTETKPTTAARRI